MAKRLAELGALQDAVSNDESSPKRLALAGYIRGLFLDWSANPYNPLSRLTARGRLLGYFWDSGAIGLSMNFADQNYLIKDGTVQSKSFSQIVNFTRTTNATVTNSAGLITYAPHNLLTYSEQFNNAAWTKYQLNTTGTPAWVNTATSPNGTISSEKLIAGSGFVLGNGTATPGVAITYTIINGITYTASFYAKKGEFNQVGCLFTDSVTNRFSRISLIDGSVVTSSGGVQTINVVSVGNDWFRISVTITSGGTGGVLSINPRDSVATTGDGLSGIYIWGAQLEIGSTATTYNSTTVKNLLGYSELFDNAAWTKSNSFVQTNLLTYSEDFTVAGWTKGNSSISANAVLAPNGYQTADKLIENTATSTHQVAQAYSSSSGKYVFSAYLKAAERTTAYLQLSDGATGSVYAIADLTAGTVTKTATGSWTNTDVSITPIGNGWYRVSAIGTQGAGTTIFPTIALGSNTSGYTGDGTSGIYIWGAQLVQGSVAGDYRRTDAAALPVYYPNHNGVVCAEQLHGTAANGTILESYTATGGSMTFSVWMRRIAGTGNVDITMDTGVTWATQAITTSWARYSITTSPTSGARTAGVRLATSGDVIQVFGGMVSDSASLDPYVLNAAAAPTAAAYYGARFDYDPVTLQPKGLLIEEQRTNLLLNSSILGTALGTQLVTVTAVAHTLSFYGTGTVAITGTYTGSLVGSGAYPTRSTLTFTPTAGVITLTVTGTVQFAQVEAGAFATSYIPTAASQVTRAADVATIQGSNFYSWYNQNEGSIYAQAQSVMSTGALTYTQFNDGTANNIIRQFASTSVTGIQVQYNSSSVASISIGVGSNNLNKIAGAYKVNDFAAAQNNVLGTADTSGDVPIVTRFSIGASSTGTLLLNGTIKSISYYPQRLSNDVLKGLTA